MIMLQRKFFPLLNLGSKMVFTKLFEKTWNLKLLPIFDNMRA